MATKRTAKASSSKSKKAYVTTKKKAAPGDARIDDLDARLDRLEALVKSMAPATPDQPRAGPKGANAAGRKVDLPTPSYAYCAVPDVAERTFGPDVSNERARLIRVMSKKWVNGTVLKYYFFRNAQWGGSDGQMEVVRSAFAIWKSVGIGLEFQEVNQAEDAQVRIGFQIGDGAWSYLGRDVLNQGSAERTMNFGWDLTRSPDEVDTAVHEIGHTLGFPHEHQNPNAGIVWNDEVVYNKLAGSPNFWPRETTFHNIIRKIPPDTVEGSIWDPNSIMHYPFEAGMIVSPDPYQHGLSPMPGLSDKDTQQVRQFYPPLEAAHPELKVYHSEILEINPGQQSNFSIVPNHSRIYHIRTFGGSDTVMVLFKEGANGELLYVAGDDDSGYDYNSSLELDLEEGAKYVLRIRLYYEHSQGSTVVLMW